MSETTKGSIHLGAALRRVKKARESTTEANKVMNMAIAIQHFENLDSYLREGGTLPEEWGHAHK